MSFLNYNVSIGKDGGLSLCYDQWPLTDEYSVHTEVEAQNSEKDAIDPPHNEFLNEVDPLDNDYSMRVRLQEMTNPFHPKPCSYTGADGANSLLSEIPIGPEDHSLQIVDAASASASSKVSFCETVSILPVQAIDSMSENEIKASWYSGEEMNEIRGDCIQTLRIMFHDDVKKGNIANGICFRGLECKAGLPSRARSTRKANARKRILQEQYLQRESNIFDPQTIAQLSRIHSTLCVSAALDAATRDRDLSFEDWRLCFDESMYLYKNDIDDEIQEQWRIGAASMRNHLSCLTSRMSVHRDCEME